MYILIVYYYFEQKHLYIMIFFVYVLESVM